MCREDISLSSGPLSVFREVRQVWGLKNFVTLGEADLASLTPECLSNRTAHGDTIGWLVMGYLHMKAKELERKTVAETHHIPPCPPQVFRIRIKKTMRPTCIKTRQRRRGEDASI